MDQVAQSAFMRAIGRSTTETWLSPATHPAQSAVFAIHNGAEQLFAAHAAQRSLKRNNLRQTGFAYRKTGNICERSAADAAIGRKQNGEQAGRDNFDRTFHRIAQLCGAMGNPLGPV